MKHPRLYGAILVSLLLFIRSVHAGSSVDLVTQLKTLEQNESMPAASVSDDSAKLPHDESSGPPGFDDTGDGSSTNIYTNNLVSIPIDTNQLWLSISNVSGGLAYLNLSHATNQVYSVWAASDLLTPFTNWVVLTELWPTNGTTNVYPFAVNASLTSNQFYRAMDWGNSSSGYYMVNGLPAWWTFYWFGNLNESASEMDASGNTLGSDFTNGGEPNLIQFALVTTNNYVNTVNPAVGLYLTAGTPSYYAISVDDTNYAGDANWQNYNSTNLTVNLGSTEGWHDVWVGLKGFATNATANWQWKRLKLDLTPPQITITNPVASTLAVPILQMQGSANETLSGISYDISNSAGVVLNQNGHCQAGSFMTQTPLNTRRIIFNALTFHWPVVQIQSRFMRPIWRAM